MEGCSSSSFTLSSGVGLFLCSSSGVAVLQHQKWGGAVLQCTGFSVGTPTILCQAICRSCQSYTLQILASRREKR